MYSLCMEIIAGQKNQKDQKDQKKYYHELEKLHKEIGNQLVSNYRNVQNEVVKDRMITFIQKTSNQEEKEKMTTALSFISFHSKEEIRKPEDDYLNQSLHFLISGKKLTFSFGGSNADTDSYRVVFDNKILYDDDHWVPSTIKYITKELGLQDLNQHQVVSFIAALYDDPDVCESLTLSRIRD